MAENRQWFKAKKYGWGWMPVSWEGWTLTVVYIALCIAAGLYLLPHASEELGVVYITAFGLFILSLTSFLIGISYRKGEAPAWRWGDKPKSKKDRDESKRPRVED
jgi:hypothetical protein